MCLCSQQRAHDIRYNSIGYTGQVEMYQRPALVVNPCLSRKVIRDSFLVITPSSVLRPAFRSALSKLPTIRRANPMSKSSPQAAGGASYSTEQPCNYPESVYRLNLQQESYRRNSISTVSMVFSRFHWAKQGSCLGSTAPS